MAAQTLKISGKKFVLIPESEYRRLISSTSRAVEPKLTVEDAEDIAICLKRMADPREKSIPWEQVKKELGLQ